MAERRAGAAREHGGRIVGVHRGRGVADRVDAPVHPQQPAIGQPAVDALAVDAGREQLPARDAAVLGARDARRELERSAHTGIRQRQPRTRPLLGANVELSPPCGVSAKPALASRPAARADVELSPGGGVSATSAGGAGPRSRLS